MPYGAKLLNNTSNYHYNKEHKGRERSCAWHSLYCPFKYSVLLKEVKYIPYQNISKFDTKKRGTCLCSTREKWARRVEPVRGAYINIGSLITTLIGTNFCNRLCYIWRLVQVQTTNCINLLFVCSRVLCLLDLKIYYI